jgi:SAM-dependent methyltransferase
MRWQDWVWIHMRPPVDRRRDERGDCEVCGNRVRFLYSRWALPPRMGRDMQDEGLRDAYRRRESLWCAACGASTRERGYWRTLIDHYGSGARSARELVAEPGFASLKIAEINRLNAGHEYLKQVPGLAYSEYPDEDIQALSYANGSFDLVLTSDTLEHVPDYRAALRESRRVLRRGGRHIFTVPLRPDLAATRNREGMTPIHHGEAPGPLALLRRPGEDMRALHDFAWDFKDSVIDAGFQLELHGEGVESVFCATALGPSPETGQAPASPHAASENSHGRDRDDEP